MIADQASLDFLSSKAFEHALLNGDDDTAQSHLAAGRDIFYGDPKFSGKIICEHPDGSREFVAVDQRGNITVIGAV